MARVGQGMIRRFQPDLVKGPDGIIHRNMEGIRIIFPVGDSGKLTEPLLIDAHEPAGKSLRRGGQQGEIKTCLLRFFIHPLPHMADDLQTQLLALRAFSVMLPSQRHQRLRKPDEAYAQSPVLQHLRHRIVHVQLIRIQPDALSHQEGIIAHLLSALNGEPVQKLAAGQIYHLIQTLIKRLDISMGFDAKAGQIDGHET